MVAALEPLPTPLAGAFVRHVTTFAGKLTAPLAEPAQRVDCAGLKPFGEMLGGFGETAELISGSMMFSRFSTAAKRRRIDAMLIGIPSQKRAARWSSPDQLSSLRCVAPDVSRPEKPCVSASADRLLSKN
jgi:hypothetical protein